ncbi:MAG: hypothetical protein CME66_04425, partial [Halobacteriovoraceae bacterium]|nr:hypothetical protein [Halobacteriovoraceae bacterium]
MKYIAFFIMIFSFISCGKDGRFIANSQQEVIYKVEPAAEEKYEYEFFLQDCSTGIQRFDSFIDACNGLTDEQRNKSYYLDVKKGGGVIFELVHEINL